MDVPLLNKVRSWLLIIGMLLVAAGCQATPAPAPTAAPTAVPTALPPPTAQPTSTPLPPTPTKAPPTATRQPPTNTPIVETDTPVPTATSTRRPVTLVPTATATAVATQVSIKYQAPELVEPQPDAIRRNGQEDLIFRWRPVGALAGNECYLVTVRVTNPMDQQFAELSYIAEQSCGDPGNAAFVEFTLHKRAPGPDYAGLVAIAGAQTASNDYLVTWSVMVIQNNGADPNKADPSQYSPLSPRSETRQFHLQG